MVIKLLMEILKIFSTVTNLPKSQKSNFIKFKKSNLIKKSNFIKNNFFGIDFLTSKIKKIFISLYKSFYKSLNSSSL